MDVMWAPWRLEYILGPKPDECVFCLPQQGRNPRSATDDEDRLVLLRGEEVFVIMNRFPYTSGHLMVVPYRHVSCVTQLSDAESLEMMRMTQTCVTALTEVLSPDGFNTGMNLGTAAGAGIAAHLHYQVVPRWNGDSSFIAVLGQTQVIPELLAEQYQRLKPVLTSHASAGA